MCRKKIWNTLLCGICICSLTACGSAKADSANDYTTDTISSETGDNTVSFSDSEFSAASFTGSVTSVVDQTITLSVAVMDGAPAGPGGPNGEAPDGPNGESPDGVAPGKPDGEAPDGPNGEAPDGEAPDKLDGEAPDKPNGEAPDGEAPDKPDGEAPDIPDSGTPGQMDGKFPGESDNMETVTVTLTIGDESVLLDSDGEAASLSEIEEGTYLTVELDSDNRILSVTIADGSMGGGMGMPGGASGGVDSYDALQEFSEDTEISGETYASSGTDENAIHVLDGSVVTLNDVTITRNSQDSTGGDNSSFYGVGASLLVTDGTVRINGGSIDSDAAGGAGVFAYGTGIAYVSDTVIHTEQDTSGGIHVAGGGTLYARDLDVETKGESSAAIRSDRGSGTMVVDGGTYTSNGTGSPAIYCTADITVNDAKLTAAGSEAICIEGLNNLRLYDCDLTGTMQENSQNDCTWNVIVYQSMSGDSEVGNGTFSMTGGTLTANNGGMFYTTNTECTFYLSDVDITYAKQNDFFLRCTGNANARGWGQSGKNGSQCSFTADAQSMEGNVVYDSISTLDFYMKNGSSLKGAFIDDESCAGSGGDGYCNVYISADSSWTVTGDSSITALFNEGTIVDENGCSVAIIGTDGTVYAEGDSPYTVTVTVYETSADMSGSADGEAYTDYAAEK